jgi:GNAT superfamily N-acetyltransferase
MPEVRELTPADAPALTTLYEDYEWWEDRAESRVEQALAESDVAVGVVTDGGTEADGDGDLAAAARVLTDYTFYAMVFDVIVAADRRGEGLGEVLVTGVRDHPDLRSVDGIELMCRDGLVPFYESMGFERHPTEVDVPEGGTEKLVVMTHGRGDE